MVDATSLAAALFGYLVGSIPFGAIVARARGVNIFTEGSGNIGATNVGRVLGRKYGYLVFVLDFLKGAIPTALAAYWRGQVDATVVFVGLMTILGHMFPAYLRLRGGKGVSTAAGVTVILLPIPMLAAVLAFAGTILASQMMSLASIVAAIVLAVTAMSVGSPVLQASTLFAIFVAGLVGYRHRDNLNRIRNGSERRLHTLQSAAGVAPMVYALMVGLWCGASWFFSFGVAPSLFATFDSVVKSSPDWLALPDGQPADLGSRLAGAAVGPMFPRYFVVQTVCGLVALGIAVGWLAVHRARRHRVRALVLGAAMLLVAAGWPISRHVSELRMARYDLSPAISEPARQSFATWHLISLALNLAVVALTIPALALAAYPPDSPKLADGETG